MNDTSCNEGFTPLAATLRQARDEIVDTWMRRCRENVAAARKLGTLALQNSVHELLAALELALKSDDIGQGARAHQEQMQIAWVHGEERHIQRRYDLAQVIHEYRLLRRGIFDVLFTAHPSLSPRAVTAVNEFIDIAVGYAADAFTRFRLRAQTLELTAERDAAVRSVDAMAATQATTRADQQQKSDALQDAQTSLSQLGEDMAVKDQFFSFLSHDLRSPLTAITLAAHTLQRRLSNTPHLQVVERIQRAAAKADKMLQEFLDSRLRNADKFTVVKFGNCDLSQIAHRLHQDINQQHEDCVALDCPSALVGHWDGAALERAIENLCSNAIKYGDATRRIHLTLREEGAHVIVSVHNFGEPISEADQSRLFKPYYRSPKAEQAAQTGWGLGLAYVWQVAQLHGGEAAVSSSEAEGTTFILRLPRDARHAFGNAFAGKPASD